MWDTEDRLGFPVRQNRFVLELDGGVVVPETHSEKIFENFGGCTRTAAGTDRRHGFPLDSLQCLKR